MKLRLTLGLGLALLAGCRSERVAFRTPTAQPAVTAPPRVVASTNEAGAAPEAKPALPLPAPDSAAPAPVRAAAPEQYKPAHWPLPAPVRNQVARPAPRPAAPKRIGWDWGSILPAIGTGLFLGGLVLGVVVGGWAGFGIFLLGSVVGLFVAFCGSFLIDGQM